MFTHKTRPWLNLFIPLLFFNFAICFVFCCFVLALTPWRRENIIKKMHVLRQLYLNNRVFLLRNYRLLVCKTQVNSTFRARWLASSEVISQVLFTSEQPEKNKMAFVAIFSQKKLLFGPLVIQLVWYILKQLLFTSVSVKLVDIHRAAKFTSTSASVLSPMPFSDWLRYTVLLTIYSVIDSE